MMLEKDNIKKRSIAIWAAVIITTAIVASMIIWKGLNEMTVSVSLSMITAIFMMVFLRKKFPDKYRKDERTVMVSARAASWSWMVTLVLVSALMWMDYMGLLGMDVTALLGLVLFVMSSTLVFFNWYLLRKGVN